MIENFIRTRTTERGRMNWDIVGISITAVLAIVAFNAWCMKLVIGNEIAKNMILIMEKFVTKQEFSEHLERCPNRIKRDVNNG